MSRRAGYLIAAVVVIGATALATLLVSLREAPETQAAPSRVPYAHTAGVVAGSGPIPVHGAGTVRPSAEIDIAPEVGGRVVWVDPDFASGRRVSKGQTLFRIEEADYEFRVRESAAALAARRVALLQAREDADLARAEYDRYVEKRPGEASPSPSSLTLRLPQLEAAEAAVKREEAALAQAKLALSRTRVVAPFDGVVRNESVDTGQLVTAGASVGRLYASDAVEVVVPLADSAVALIPRLWVPTGNDQMSVVARVIAEYGDSAFAWQGYVDRADASLDLETRTIDVIIRVSDPFAPGTAVGSRSAPDNGPPLLVGKFVEVILEGRAPTSYFRMPRAALQTGDEVWSVADGTVRIVPVQVLQHIDDEVYVTGSLDEVEAVVTGGIRFATDGMAVRTDAAEGR